MISRRHLLAAAVAATTASSSNAHQQEATRTFVAQSVHLRVEIPAHWTHTPPHPIASFTIGADDGYFATSPGATSEDDIEWATALWPKPAINPRGSPIVLGAIKGKRFDLPATDVGPASTAIICENPNPILTFGGMSNMLLLMGDNNHFDEIIATIRFGIESVSHTDLASSIIDWVHAHSYFRDDVDWHALYDRAGAIQTRQAINEFLQVQLLGMLHDAGDNHSMLMNVSAIMTSRNAMAGTTIQIPTGEIVSGFGYLAFPENLGLSPETMQEYIQQGCLLRNEFHDAGVCGWIIDLRNMRGGSVSPLLTALYPFLPDGKLAGFVDAYGKESWIEKHGTTITPATYLHDAGDIPWPEELSDPSIPIAVLTGPNNGSAGEFVQLALMSRQNLQTFGMRTAGYTTGNIGLPLFNGMHLALASSAELDAQGNVYTSYIEPDVEDIPLGSSNKISEDQLATVLEWLHQQCAAEVSARHI